MRIYQNKVFLRFVNKSGIDNSALCKAIREAEGSLIAADLGGGLIKQRIARPGQGKSGGFRVLIVLMAGVKALFIHGFAKNEESNISRSELSALKKLAAELIALTDAEVARAVALEALIEVICHEETIP